MAKSKRNRPSPLFTFLVGQKRKPYVVHRNVIDYSSPILKEMMRSSNNSTSEYPTGFIELPDVTTETFNLFDEFIYTGDYRLPRSINSFNYLEEFDVKCYWCNEQSMGIGTFSTPPVFCPKCNDQRIVVGDINTRSVVHFNKDAERIDARTQLYHRQKLPDEAYTRLFGLHGCITQHKGGKKIREFKNRQYPALAGTHADVAGQFDSMGDDWLPNQKLCAHARLYLFAQKYQVTHLKEYCLHRLHRDLMAFSVRLSSVDEIVDLLTVVYKGTPDTKDKDFDHLPGTCDDDEDEEDDGDDEEEDEEDDDDVEGDWLDDEVHEYDWYDYQIALGERIDDTDDEEDDEDDEGGEGDDEDENEGNGEGDDGDGDNDSESDVGQSSRNSAMTSKLPQRIKQGGISVALYKRLKNARRRSIKGKVADTASDGKKLRDLVMTYAGLQATFLMSYTSFKQMLQKGGQLVSDFAKQLIIADEPEDDDDEEAKGKGKTTSFYNINNNDGDDYDSDDKLNEARLRGLHDNLVRKRQREEDDTWNQNKRLRTWGLS